MNGTVKLRRVRVRRLVTMAVALVALGPALAAAQLSASDTGRCINAINKGIRKVTLAASKEMRGCVGEATRAACSARRRSRSASRRRAGRAEGGPGRADLRRQLLRRPAAGLRSAEHQPPTAARDVQLDQELLGDLFGPTPESVLATELDS